MALSSTDAGFGTAWDSNITLLAAAGRTGTFELLIGYDTAQHAGVEAVKKL